ncbi:hypothetical protein LZK73_16090 [Neorhizobium galegae]|nr:hypothetical protein LZK73_16090 [Neorhizobium galegae]
MAHTYVLGVTSTTGAQRFAATAGNGRLADPRQSYWDRASLKPKTVGSRKPVVPPSAASPAASVGKAFGKCLIGAMPPAVEAVQCQQPACEARDLGGQMRKEFGLQAGVAMPAGIGNHPVEDEEVFRIGDQLVQKNVAGAHPGVEPGDEILKDLDRGFGAADHVRPVIVAPYSPRSFR